MKGSVISTSLSTPQALRQEIEKVLDERKAIDIVTIDLENKSSIADYLVIASGTSSRHVGAMAQILREDLKKQGVKDISVEGFPQCDWVLLDAGDVVVHLFRPEVREFYNIEKMWDMPEPSRTAAKTSS